MSGRATFTAAVVLAALAAAGLTVAVASALGLFEGARLHMAIVLGLTAVAVFALGRGRIGKDHG
ncbi:hypothetical protein [Pseudooceanicola nanhaiensis]|uniref:hypothetical protein n=1 Tax=Pseudooceanicola nanhaiensis TaxID=375761 RepID=UPI001CD5991E|nr:hypothetical protein [Pseudooceanicola nanhaiensis]MCA0919836.1 hypothetical protein [Pseudooceanicola nanhaiensis]